MEGRLMILPQMLVVVLLCGAVSFTRGDGGVDKEAEGVWAAAFPHLPIPATVLTEESPLTSQEAALWAEKVKAGDGGSELCSQARLLCTPRPRISIETDSDSAYDWYYCDPPYMAAKFVPPGHFFRFHQMFVGASMIQPNLNHPVPSHPYLPHVVAQHLSLTPTALPRLLTIFGISNTSDMADVMRQTINRCNLPDSEGSPKTCVSSIEGMVQFVTGQLGSSVDVLESQPSPKFGKNQTVARVKSLIGRTKIHDSNVVCHKILFPSMIRVCHELQSTKVYEAVLQPEQGHPIQAIGICHFDTSKWDPHHPSFAVLGTSPGEGEVCHWVRADEHIWIHV